MLILGIESSCDETAAGVVQDGTDVRSNVIASQHRLHEEYAGVVPEIASRAHTERILPVIRRALDEAGVALADVDAIAVGHRPGLIGSLLVGVAAAKALAWSLSKPLIGIDHLHAHLYAPLLAPRAATGVGGATLQSRVDAVYPALGLVVSGGHTALYRATAPLEITRLGATIDDAVGEAFDKVATILGLPHPGGPAIDRLALDGDDHAHDFPVSALDKGSLDFSFSGVKTALLYAVRGRPVTSTRGKPAFERDHTDLTDQARADLAASFQRAAVNALLLKINRALDQWRDNTALPPPCSLIVGGGVSANARLRHELAHLALDRRIELLLPPKNLCLDNAAMIAGLAYHRAKRGDVDDLTLAAAPAGVDADR